MLKKTQLVLCSGFHDGIVDLGIQHLGIEMLFKAKDTHMLFSFILFYFWLEFHVNFVYLRISNFQEWLD